MNQIFAVRQQIRIVGAPPCPIAKYEQTAAWGSGSSSGTLRLSLLQKSLGSIRGSEVYCSGVTGTIFCRRKQTSASIAKSFSLRSGIKCTKKGQTRDTQRRRGEFKEQLWSFWGRGGTVRCQFSRRTVHNHDSSEKQTRATQEKGYNEESNTVSTSFLPGFHSWFSLDFGLTSDDLKLWFRCVFSTVLALTICVPQALGLGAVLGDLAVNNCEDPETDYAPLKGLEGEALKGKLHDLVKDHKVYTYLQAWDALKVLDEAEDDHDSVIDIYSQKKQPKSAQGKTTGWNREHLWPRSFGLIEGQPGFSDLHNLRPADTNVNSSRGNKAFADCSTQALQCTVPANKEAAPDTGTNKDIWMPPGQVRGDIARAVFYMAVRYGSEQPAGIKALSLSNSPDVEEEVMGILEDLVRWNEIDLPSDSERERNDKVCSLYQHNRNPFVDHPEFVKAIWGDGSADVPLSPQPSLPAGEITAWINELHYDNSGADQNEFVEVIMGQDVDPSLLKLVLYNSAGKEYRSLSLGDGKEFSRVDGVGDGFSLYVARLPSGTLQNGPADGLALVDVNKNGKVIQILSYGGTFEAVDGPAKGRTSSDIGVKEGVDTPVGSSLGLTGTGNKYGDFRWSVFRVAASPGTLNSGQTLLSAPYSK